MKPHTHNRLELLQDALESLRHRQGWNRERVATEIVEAIDRLGMWEDLAQEGIWFKDSGDHFRNATTRAQKVYRWLGAYSENPADIHKLFFLEQAIVAAMPEDLKIEYLSQVYSGSGVGFGALNHGSESSILDSLKRLSKETNEAERAIIDLLDGATPIELQAAEKELGEVVIATQDAIETIKNLKK